MAAAMPWLPAGKGEFAKIDWAALPSDAAFDPYVCWHDFTGSLWMHESNHQTRLIVALKQPLTKAGLLHLNQRGLRVAPHFTRASLHTMYITGVCVDASALKKFCEAAFKGDDDWIARYEVSEGFFQPDAIVESPGGGQKWDALGMSFQVPSPLVGFIDYGCAFLNRQFRAADGTSRIAALWDQQDNDRPAPPPSRKPLAWREHVRYGYGRFIDAVALKEYADQFRATSGSLDESTCYRYSQYEPVLRTFTHGTHVMDIATGYPNPLLPLDGRTADSRHAAAIAFVQLPRYRGAAQLSGLLKAQVLDAVHYVASLRVPNQPAVVNLSYGSYCGPHDGSSILELALDDLIQRSENGAGKPQLHIVVPAGNASKLAGHAQALIGSLQRQSISWSNLPNDPSESFVEIWAPEAASIRLRATPPGRSPSDADWVKPGQAKRLDLHGRTVAMLVHARNPCQSPSGQLVLFATRATLGHAPAPHGTWTIEIENTGSSPVLVDAWCERDDPVFGSEGGPRQARFESHVERTATLNSIAHGRHTVVVGGYDLHSGLSARLPGLVSVISSSGPGRGLPGRQRHPAGNDGSAKNGPEVLGPCDMGLGEPGLPGAAVLSGDQVRLMGTSVAAAAYTRWLLDEMALPPAPPPARVAPVDCPVSPPGRDPHPDDCEPIPRVP